MSFQPHFDDDHRRTCTAYANVNPWLPGQRVLGSERLWSVHDRSTHLQIRYVGRYRARDERGRLRWWVNAHSSAPEDRDRPWGFVAADCIFAGRAAPIGGAGSARRFTLTAAERRAQALRLAHVSTTPPGGTRCGFGAVAFHTMTLLRGLDCAAARGVLERLRGDDELVLIACERPRRVRGWRLTNLLRDPSMTVVHYARGARSFDLAQHQFPGAVVCPPA